MKTIGGWSISLLGMMRRCAQIPTIERCSSMRSCGHGRQTEIEMKFQIAFCSLLLLLLGCASTPPVPAPRFHVVVMADLNGIHAPYVVAAKAWLNKLAA